MRVKQTRAKKGTLLLSDGIALVLSWDFAVRTAKSLLAILSVMGRISVATRRFVRTDSAIQG
jgi:hypothetical protein